MTIINAFCFLPNPIDNCLNILKYCTCKLLSSCHPELYRMFLAGPSATVVFHLLGKAVASGVSSSLPFAREKHRS